MKCIVPLALLAGSLAVFAAASRARAQQPAKTAPDASGAGSSPGAQPSPPSPFKRPQLPAAASPGRPSGAPPGLASRAPRATVAPHHGPAPLTVTARTASAGPRSSHPRSSHLVLNMQWDFGDGTIIRKSNAAPVTHTYAEPGTYQVRQCALTLSLRDSQPRRCPETVRPIATITVTNPAEAR